MILEFDIGHFGPPYFWSLFEYGACSQTQHDAFRSPSLLTLMPTIHL